MIAPRQSGTVARATRFDAADLRRGEHTYLVVYDISDPHRLRRVARACEDQGIRIQKSVFECRLTAVRFESFWQRLQELIEPKEDGLAAYPLCRACIDGVQVAGSTRRSDVGAEVFVI